MLTLIIITIALAFFFDFLNGFHDAANSIATIVSTRVLKPHHAVIWAAFFNFIAFLFFGLNVAGTIGTGLIDPSIVDTHLILAALCGAIFWNIFTWYFGIPSSSSHALIGGLLGAAIAKAGFAPLKMAGISKVLIAIIISPLLGLIIGLLLMFITARFFFNFTPSKIDHIFRKLIKMAGPVYYSFVDSIVALTGLMWGYFLFHEKLNEWTTAAVLLIVFALLLVTKRTENMIEYAPSAQTESTPC